MKKIYSSFQCHYLSLYEVYSSQDNLFEQIIADYLLNTLKELILITYELYHNSAFFSSRNIFMNHIRISESVINVVICTEGNCFLIECIDEILITTVLNLTKSSLINLSRTQFIFNKDEMEEIRNFSESVNIFI